MATKRTEFIVGLLFVSGLCYVTYRIINRKKTTKEEIVDDLEGEDTNLSANPTTPKTPKKTTTKSSTQGKTPTKSIPETKKGQPTKVDYNPNKKKAININGVLIYVSDDKKGHLVFEGGGRLANFKLNAKVKKLGVTLWKGVVSVARISKINGGGIRITDNTGKSFDGEDTDLIPLVNQFKKGNNKLLASIGSADINLERTA